MLFYRRVGPVCEPAVTDSIEVNTTSRPSHKGLAVSPLLLRAQSNSAREQDGPRKSGRRRRVFYQVIVVAALTAMAGSSLRLEIRAENVAFK